MAFQVIKHDGTFTNDTVLDTDDIDDQSMLGDPEFIMFCIEADIDDSDSLDDLITQFNY